MFGYKIDILNLEWPHSERDRHIIMPVYLYLREKYKLNIKSENIFNGYFYLLKYRPKLLLVSNSIGADINFLLTKAAHEIGIKVISLISEGNVEERQADILLWGWNKDKIMYEDNRILWSSKSKNIFLRKYQNLTDKLYVSGATGFDRYKLLRFMDKKSFLTKNNFKKYKKIIGIASWGFDSLFEDSPSWNYNKDFLIKTFGNKEIGMYRNDLFLIKKIYRELIERNNDKLFILRYHPGTTNFKKTEFWRLENYENVYISNPLKNHNDSISDLINISDLWIGYNSTTLIEAWLLRKTTFLINPTRSDFMGNNIYKGSLIVATYSEAQMLIDEFFREGKIDRFNKMKEMRKKIIREVIEYDDGKNYIRAAEKIYKIFSENNYRKKNINYFKFPFLRMLKQIINFGYKNFHKKYDIVSDLKYYESKYLEPIRYAINESIV